MEHKERPRDETEKLLQKIIVLFLSPKARESASFSDTGEKLV